MTTRREHRLVFLLSVAPRRLQRWIAAQTQQSGVTAAQSGLLFVLGQRDGVLIGEAGAAVDLGPPRRRGLLGRVGGGARGGRTPHARSALGQSKAGLAEVNARLTDGFSEAEIDVVARWLTGLQ